MEPKTAGAFEANTASGQSVDVRHPGDIHPLASWLAHQEPLDQIGASLAPTALAEPVTTWLALVGEEPHALAAGATAREAFDAAVRATWSTGLEALADAIGPAPVRTLRELVEEHAAGVRCVRVTAPASVFRALEVEPVAVRVDVPDEDLVDVARMALVMAAARDELTPELARTVLAQLPEATVREAAELVTRPTPRAPEPRSSAERSDVVAWRERLEAGGREDLRAAIARAPSPPVVVAPSPSPPPRTAYDDLVARWTARLDQGGRRELEAVLDELPAIRVVEVPVELVFVAVNGMGGSVQATGPTPELAQRQAFREAIDAYYSPQNLADESDPSDVADLGDLVRRDLVRRDLADLVVVPLHLPRGIVEALNTVGVSL